MLLAVAATEIEMQPFLARCKGAGESLRSLVSGVGPLETALTLGLYLSRHGDDISRVLNFGVAGAYPDAVQPAALLDVCLAETEIIGDYGLCFEDRIEPLPGELGGPHRFSLDQGLLQSAQEALFRENIQIRMGTFVTVSCSSSCASRARMLAERFGGLCENMEGAAVARVCREFSLPLLELRAISNMVEDRDVARWRLEDACETVSGAAALLVAQKVV
ncbi:MAG: futalosine hydrolase [Thermodesulfobacteriota bacterium]